MTTTPVETRVRGGIGESVARADGVPKVTGDFAFASDLYADGMLWGATRHAFHAHARITRLDVAPALAMAGVRAVLTQDDVPGAKLFGQEHADQPVLADGEVRYWGEPVAVVAADDPDTARRAAEAIVVDYEPLEPLVDPEEALARDEVLRRVRIRRGDPAATGEVVIEGYYEVGQQDQAPLGTEAGLAIPDGEGGLDLYVTSQWTHVDHRQIVACLDVAPDQVRQHPTGIGGAFGAREDMSVHVHLCLLAQRTGRPVKMVYDRAESFVGHVHRHPARMWYRHEADADGRLQRVTARLIVDGGPYLTTSGAVIGNASYFAVGPYRCDSVEVDGFAVRTNNPPAGAMRGFGAVQVCFAYETQMDRLAAAVGIDPVEVRRRNLLQQGDEMATSGQVVEGPLPSRRVLDELEAMPMPGADGSDHPFRLPGGTGLTTPPAAVRRGVGYALGLKNIAFSEGFDDYAEAEVVLTSAGAEIHSAAVEVGQGMVTACRQIARSALGLERVAWVAADTSAIGSAGSTSASRQTQMTGGAVHDAAVAVRDEVLGRYGGDRLDDAGVWLGGELLATLDEVCARGPIRRRVRFRHPDTEPGDPETGQGDTHADFAVAGHRAVVDVDPELGLLRIVRIDTAQDVGKALNPQSVIGQIEGGIMQGVGLAIMEELVLDRGVIRNGNFTDYLLPTFADAPEVGAVLIEEGSRFGPFGAKGVGEPPTISSTPAIVAAIRAATGRELHRVPVRPQDIVGL